MDNLFALLLSLSLFLSSCTVVNYEISEKGLSIATIKRERENDDMKQLSQEK